jgi:hypothetical protein
MQQYGSDHVVASDELLSVLRKEFAQVSKPGVWAHSVLTQAFCMPSALAVEVLEGRLCIAMNKKYWT